VKGPITGLFTVPNLFSLLRIVLLPFIIIELKRGTAGGNRAALILMLIAVATDFLDGYFARKLNQRSDAGRIIDPLADKIAVAVISYTLTSTHGLPFWFFVLLISRDLAILLLAPFLMRHWHRIPESNWPGKVAVTAVAVVIILYTMNMQPLALWALYLSLVFIAVSIWSYMKRFLATLKGSN